jgi:hypothetical protein
MASAAVMAITKWPISGASRPPYDSVSEITVGRGGLWLHEIKHDAVL